MRKMLTGVLAVAVIALFFGSALAKDRDNNPPGKKGGPGTNWENPPGKAGGPGAGPNAKAPPSEVKPPKKEFCAKHPTDPKCTGAPPPKKQDKDNNPPGAAGGPGTNWENPPGQAGGPGAGPDHKPKPPKR